MWKDKSPGVKILWVWTIGTAAVLVANVATSRIRDMNKILNDTQQQSESESSASSSSSSTDTNNQQTKTTDSFIADDDKIFASSTLDKNA